MRLVFCWRTDPVSKLQADVMSFLRHRQIYHPIAGLYRRKQALPLRSRRHRLMSLRPAIPWWVALLQSSPPVTYTDAAAAGCQQKLAGRSVGELLMMLSGVPINGRF